MAIKINNTTVIDNNRQLTALANVDTASYDAIVNRSNFPGDAIKATYMVTSTGNWTKAGGVSGDYVIAYCINGGSSGAAVRSGNNNIAQGGYGGNCMAFGFDYDALPATVGCVIGAGGPAQVNSTATTIKPGVYGGDTTFNGFGCGLVAHYAAFGQTATGAADGAIGASQSDYVVDMGGYANSIFAYYIDANQLIRYQTTIVAVNGSMGKTAFKDYWYGQRTYGVDSARNGNNLPQYTSEVCACGCPAAMDYNNVLRVGYNKNGGGTFAQTGTGGYGAASTTTIAASAGNNYGAGGGGVVVSGGTGTSGAGYQGIVMIAILAGSGKPMSNTSIKVPDPHLIASKLGIAS